MSYFDDASLVMIPSGYKDQKVYSVKPIDGSGDLTFSRASNATRVNSSGLVEKVRTNNLPYSEAFENAAWIKQNGASVVANVAANPLNGALTADRLIIPTTASSRIEQVPPSGWATSGQLITLSCYIKGFSGGGIVGIRSGIVGDSTLWSFNASTWTRVTWTKTAGSNYEIPQFCNGTLVAGADASVDILAFGFQIEVSDIATDYIATTSAAVSVGPVSGLPRLDYSGGASCPSLLLEPQRTNLVTFSEQFDNAAWAKTRTTVSANSVTSPDGYTNADTITPNTTNDSHLVSPSTLINLGGVVGTFSVFAKYNGYHLSLSIAGSAADWTGCVFDLQNGIARTPQNSGAQAVCTSKIEDYGNGWYRCSITYTPYTGGTFYTNIGITSTNNATLSSFGLEYYAGNATSGGFVWGAQLETGDIATDYIATTSAAVSVGPVSGLPRLDYSGGASCPSLLLEPQRTNNAFPSENFSGYTGTAATVVSNQATSPDGYANADLIYPSVSGSFAGKYLTLAPSTTGVVSCFVKQAGKRYAIIGTDNNATFTCIFDLQTASVVYEATNYTGKIEAYSNGWYRISAAYTSSTAANYPFIGLADGSNGAVTTDGTNGLYIWGFQYETSASYATSYIPTLSSAVTRVADAASKTGISSLIGQTEGVVYFEWDYQNVGSSGGNIVVSLAGVGLQELYFWVKTDGSYSYDVYDSTKQVGITGSIGSFGIKKIALVYKNNDFALYINGVLVGSDTNGSVPTLTDVYIGKYAISNNYNISSGIKQVLLFKTRLSNADLATLTTL